MKTTADVDIDLADRNTVLQRIKHIPASRIDRDGMRQRHNTGVYVQDIPCDPFEQISSIDFNDAEQRGYFKLDFLNMNVYSRVQDRQHLKELLSREPEWSQVWEDHEFCERIVHIGNHFDRLKQLKPGTIPRMAMFLAVIRPAKAYLIPQGWKKIAEHVWIKPKDDSYYFKKSHAVSYAHLVKININLEQM